MKRSDLKLKKYHDKPFEVADRDSISITVSAKGKIAWQFRFRYNNKADRLTLGHYPNISVSDARRLVQELKGLLFDGKNPKLVWQKNKNREEAKFTLIKLVEYWFKIVGETKLLAFH